MARGIRREDMPSILASNPRVDSVALNVDGAVTLQRLLPTTPSLWQLNPS